jgi:hypothetical protein
MARKGKSYLIGGSGWPSKCANALELAGDFQRASGSVLGRQLELSDYAAKIQPLPVAQGGPRPRLRLREQRIRYGDGFPLNFDHV